MNVVISAQDYDAWGHLQLERSYNISSMKYDYTGKERDNESNYDYFGARYYDSRIANWGSIDPLFEAEMSTSPYSYVTRNPIRYFDIGGGIKFPQELASKYPKLVALLEKELPKMVKDKKVLNALEKWTKLPSETIVKDFQKDEGPTLNPKNISNWGSFNPEEDENIINVKESLLEFFENSVDEDADAVLKFFIAVVIMHEYTHYGANKAGQSFFYYEDGKLKRDEEGLRFEQEVYGQMIGGPDVAATYMNKKNKKRGSAKRYPTNIEEQLRKSN